MTQVKRSLVRTATALVFGTALAVSVAMPASAVVHTNEYYTSKAKCVTSAEWYTNHGWSIVVYCDVTASSGGVAHQWYSLFQRG
ncbi:hypothetical protein EYE40_10210 [Glaciihabitans arcticus]|uniref:Chitin-binding type-3 domain-containing protein n=1 Tax=Glaciihabitans arcticus TaxID=2668039 RepID=A0A4Q9GZB1_9MICO|nr:hypothetical protein [Glaciihabitans arcticus]TBN57730.1 hypothetical protein EYE40_10210 [Glaciihabitans arcticus]